MQNKHKNITKSQNKSRNQSFFVPYRPNPNFSRFAKVQSVAGPTQPSRPALTFSLAKYGKLASAPHPYFPAPCCRSGPGRQNGTDSEGQPGLHWFPQPPRRPFRTIRDRCSKRSIQIGRGSSSRSAEDKSGTLNDAPIE